MTASILAWPGALAIGVSLGLPGSGGSIITVPVLVYLLGQDEKIANAGSLFVVGKIALAGSLQYIWPRLIDWRNVFIFGAPGMVGTYAGAKIANRMSQDKLTKGFGFFLIVMGIYILARSVPSVLELAA